MENRIAIIGMSGVFPEAMDIEEFYENLKSGKDSVRELPKERIESSTLNPSLQYKMMGCLNRVDLFDNSFFNISRREACYMDPSHRLLLELSVKAIENAGYSLGTMAQTKTGVYIGLPSFSLYDRLITEFDPTVFVGNLPAMTAGRIAYHLNLCGPALAISTTCSSSLVAVHEACKSLQLEDCDLALVGAARVHTHFSKLGDVDSIGIESSDGKTRAFDNKSDGTGNGEGGGVIILKRLDKAIRDNDNIQAIILGSAINQDGARSNGITSPSPMAQEEVIKEAWKKAKIDPETISFIEAHGTGTRIGDPIEIQGLQKAFRKFTDKQNVCALSAVKTNIGHLDNAAGIAGLIKAVISLKKKELFSTVHFTTLNSLVDFSNSPVYINHKLQKWETPLNSPRRCGVSSFGFIGTNAHVVLEERIGNEQQSTQYHRPLVLKIAAKTISAFNNYAKQFEAYFKTNDINAADACYTLNTGRSDHRFRTAILGRSKAELINKLTLIAADAGKITECKQRSAIVLLSGGKLPEDVNRSLYTNYQVYREASDLITNSMTRHGQYFEEFKYLYASYKLLRSFGINIQISIATGVGAIASAAVEGKIDIKEAEAQLIRFTHADPDLGKLRALLNKLPVANNIFIELGSEPVLSAAIKQVVSSIDVLGFISIDHDPLEQLAHLYGKGLDIDWVKYHATDNCFKVEAPTYPFDKIRCWYKEPDLKIAESNDGKEGTPQYSLNSIVAPEIQSFSEGKGRDEIESQDENIVVYAEKEVIQKEIAAIWKHVLMVDVINENDDFFELGGHSLNATQVVNKISRLFNVNVSLEDIFDNGTLELLTEFVLRSLKAESISKPGNDGIRPAEVKDSYVLSNSQRRMWIMSQTEEGSLTYNIPLRFLIKGQIDTNILERSFTELIVRHEALRTVFIVDHGEPRQKILSVESVNFKIKSLDLFSTGGDLEDAQKLLLNESKKAFDLTAGPLLRVLLVRISKTESVLFINIHHIICDGWSLTLMFDELLANYKSINDNSFKPFPPLSLQYKDYAEWQSQLFKSDALKESKQYWAGKLSGRLPVTSIPVDFNRPSFQSFEGDIVNFSVQRDLEDAIRKTALETGTTVFLVMLTSLKALVYFYTKNSDSIFGADFSGRINTDVEKIVGMFINVMVLRSSPKGSLSYSEYLLEVKQLFFEAQKHQDYQFDDIVADVVKERDFSRNPLFDIMFLMQNNNKTSVEPGDLGFSISEMADSFVRAPFDLSLLASDTKKSISFSLKFNIQLYKKQTIELLGEQYVHLLKLVTSQPDLTLAELNEAIVDFTREKDETRKREIKARNLNLLKDISNKPK
jgi:3-oxoacyl-(acyl-carrier-protein) synthase/acyl carrier protein